DASACGTSVRICVVYDTSYKTRRIRRMFRHGGENVNGGRDEQRRPRHMRKALPVGGSPRREVLQREAEHILATVRTLYKDLLRNPYAEAEEQGVTGPQVTVMACLVGK